MSDDYRDRPAGGTIALSIAIVSIPISLAISFVGFGDLLFPWVILLVYPVTLLISGVLGCVAFFMIADAGITTGKVALGGFIVGAIVPMILVAADGLRDKGIDDFAIVLAFGLAGVLSALATWQLALVLERR